MKASIINSVERLELTTSKSGVSYFPMPCDQLDKFTIPKELAKTFLSLSSDYFSGLSSFENVRTNKSILTSLVEIDKFDTLVNDLIHDDNLTKICLDIRHHFESAKEYECDFICFDMYQSQKHNRD